MDELEDLKSINYYISPEDEVAFIKEIKALIPKITLEEGLIVECHNL